MNHEPMKYARRDRNMTSNLRRFLALLMTAIMLLGMMPTDVMASEGGGEPPPRLFPRTRSYDALCSRTAYPPGGNAESHAG